MGFPPSGSSSSNGAAGAARGCCSTKCVTIVKSTGSVGICVLRCRRPPCGADQGSELTRAQTAPMYGEPGPLWRRANKVLATAASTRGASAPGCQRCSCSWAPYPHRGAGIIDPSEGHRERDTSESSSNVQWLCNAHHAGRSYVLLSLGLGLWLVTGADYFQLPTSLMPREAPSSISVRRERPRHRTMLPGGGSLARAR
jgi:hypothetical protein